MKTKFHYEKKDTYSQEELANLLAQAEVAVLKTAREGYVPSTEFDELKTSKEQLENKLGEYQSKERTSITERIGKTILKDKYDKVSKYISFAEDFDYTDEKAIEAKFQEVHQDLFPIVENDPFENGAKEVGKVAEASVPENSIVNKMDQEIK